MQCALPCLIIGNTVAQTGLPASYGIDWNTKLAFVLTIVPSAACWYAFLGSGLRGEQSYSPTRPMMFRRGTPSVIKELLSGLSYAIAQLALLWFVFRPMLIADGASALLLEDGRPLVAYGVGTICNVVLFTISFLLRGTLYVRHVPTHAAWRVQHRPGDQRHGNLARTLRIQHHQCAGSGTESTRRSPSLGSHQAPHQTSYDVLMGRLTADFAKAFSRDLKKNAA